MKFLCKSSSFFKPFTCKLRQLLITLQALSRNCSAAYSLAFTYANLAPSRPGTSKGRISSQYFMGRIKVCRITTAALRKKKSSFVLHESRQGLS